MLKYIFSRTTTIKVDRCIFYSLFFFFLTKNATDVTLYIKRLLIFIDRQQTTLATCVEWNEKEKKKTRTRCRRLKERQNYDYLKCKLSSTIYSEACLPSRKKRPIAMTVPMAVCAHRQHHPMAIIIKILYWYILCVQWFVVAFPIGRFRFILTSSKQHTVRVIIEFLLSRHPS